MVSADPLRHTAQQRDAEREWRDRLELGPTRLRWRTLPPQAGDPAPDRTLPDRDGRRRRLSTFWREGPALLIFWRQFGCECGVERADRLRLELPGYEDRGARVVVVGQGEPERAAAYADEYGLDCTVLCDPFYETAEAYGLLETTSVGVFYDAPAALRRLEPRAVDELVIEHREAGRPLVDNPWLLPAEFVVDRRGTIVHAHRYDYRGDFPDPRVHELAIERATTADEDNDAGA